MNPNMYWARKLMELNNSSYIVDNGGDKYLSFTGESIFYLAKMSGLKSGKKRHIIKRGKLVAKELLYGFIDTVREIENGNG